MVTLSQLLKRSPNVEIVSPEMLRFEQSCGHYFKEIYPLVDNTIEIGLEIEIEHVKDNMVDTYPLWSPRADGSLRDHGLEYVTVPMKGPRIHFALNQFFDMINSGYRFSPRTSIHVHVNVLNMNPHQVAVFLMTFGLFEKPLYRFVGQDRDKSNFCVPMFLSSYQCISHFIQFMPGQVSFVLPMLENHRYAGVNVDAVRKFGSLEFRHLHGTDDKIKLLKWINFLFRMKQFAMKTSLSEMKTVIQKMNTDSSYGAFAERVFGESRFTFDCSQLRNDLEGCVSGLKKLFVVDSFCQKLQRSVTKDSLWYAYLTKPKISSTQKTFSRPGQVRPARAAGRIPLGIEADQMRIDGMGRVVRVAPQQNVAPAPDAGQQAIDMVQRWVEVGENRVQLANHWQNQINNWNPPLPELFGEDDDD